MSIVTTAEGVQFSVIAPGGFRILAALVSCASAINHDITITSGTDGTHSGPSDPHHLGRAYDIRSHDLPDKEAAFTTIMSCLNDGPVTPGDGGLLTEHFFGWIEDAGQPNEHIHCQVRHGTEIS